MAAFWSASGQPATSIVERMLAAAPHRGSVARVVATTKGAVGVSGDAGVEGVAADGGWLVAYAGAVDNPDAFGAAAAAGGDATAGALLARARSASAVELAASLRGFHSVVVVDPEGISYWRDHLGYSSLFHRRSGDSVFVASEAKQVVEGAGLRREPNLDVVARVFLARAHPDTPAALAGVERVQRRRCVRVGDSRQQEETFWDPIELLESGSMGKQEFTEAFEFLMDQAVRRTMRGPDAVALSGGVDSPAVLAFAAPAHRQIFGTPIAAISSIYPDQPSVDESRYIELVSDHFEIPRHAQVPSARATDDLDRWVRLFDSPYPAVSISESEEFYLWAASLGYSVVLTGEVAEYLTEMSTHTSAHLLLSGRFPALVRRLSRERSRGRAYSRIGRRLLRSSLSDPMLERLRRLRGRDARFPRPAWIVDPPDFAEPVRPGDTRWEREQLGFFGGSDVLFDAHDAITAATRVEVRRPFSDIDLWEATLRLRAEVKHADPAWKGLLRSVLRGHVPDPILDRRDKTVFDDNLLANIDYDALGRWLIDPRHRLPWIDYGLVGDAIEHRSLDLLEFMWMKDLAAVHAFLDQW